uniref:R13L1/DRL21-like LRR repeat region domain-containing protein n=2 Tax=Daucus carota subsp. sativus TaxID=79200 RepID=A0A164TWA3_DAUCS
MFRQAREDPWRQLLPADHLNSYLLQTKSGSHAEILTVHVRRNVSNIEEARRANLYVKSNIRHLVLSWENNEDERGDGEYKDEDVMNGLEAHPNLKELTVEGFMGKNLASWITKMNNLVKITLKDCNRCEVLPPLSRIESLEIKNCLRLRKIPDSCCRALKEVIIGNMESTMILETISKNASSLTTLKLGGGKSCRSTSSSYYSSDMESIINVLLRSNSLSLSTLELIECKSVQRLTVGVSLERLWVYDCPNLMSIKLDDEGSAGLKSLSVRKCSSSLLNTVSAQIQSSTLERLKLGPFLGNIDEFPWPFSSSSNSFPNLDSLELFGWDKVKSRPLFEQLQSTFPRLKELIINNFKQVKDLPDLISRLLFLEKLIILDCNNLDCLPKFEESHRLQLLKIIRCPSLRERCMKDSGPEWFKIKHIPIIKWE